MHSIHNKALPMKAAFGALFAVAAFDPYQNTAFASRHYFSGFKFILYLNHICYGLQKREKK